MKNTVDKAKLYEIANEERKKAYSMPVAKVQTICLTRQTKRKRRKC